MKLMKRITKFIINVTSVGSIVLIATLNTSQFAVMKGATPPVEDTPGGTIPGGPRNNDTPFTESGGPRFIQPTEDIDAPPPGRVRSVRGGCASSSQLSLTALVPTNKIGRTVSEYPTFFFYLPKTEAELAELILEDESGNQIYQQDLTIKNLSGVIGVSIPANTNVPPLEVGKSYTWKFTVVCDPNDRSSDQLESGVVRRVELSADILSELEQADPRQKTFIYAQNGIWQDALSTLAAARRANPNDPVFQTDWESLLDAVTLGKIAKEPIVEIEPQP
jgi:hypothetical protein